MYATKRFFPRVPTGESPFLRESDVVPVIFDPKRRMTMKRYLIFALSALLLYVSAASAEEAAATLDDDMAEILAIQEEFGIQICAPTLGGMSPHQVARFEKLKALAETDKDVNSTFLLAECYQYGIGTEEDWAQAFFWYTVCAEQGDADGQYALAVCYEYGMGTEKDLDKALEYYEKSALQGDAYAQADFERLTTKDVETNDDDESQTYDFP